MSALRRLSSDVADVWVIDLTRSEPNADAALLSGHELRRAERFGSDVARHRYVTTRAAARRLLAERLGCDARGVPIVAGARGKPMLEGRTDLHFNASHSGDRALVAVAAWPVGVDIEAVPETVGPRDFAPAFTAEELEALDAMAPGDRVTSFYRWWVRKESVAKATGAGVALPMRSVTMALRPVGASESGAYGDWWVVDLEPDPGYAGAVAVPRDAV